MEQPKRNLKPLPILPKKGKIFEMYNSQIASDQIRKKLNQLIEMYCKKTGLIYKTGYSNIALPVWVEWVKIFGFPAGYETNEDLLNQPGLD